MKKIGIALLGCLLAGLTVAAQEKPAPKISVFGNNLVVARATTRLIYATQQGFIGEVAIHYGEPEWKKDYEDEAKFDALTKGKTWRFGRDFWTTLDTNIPIKIADKEIPVGSWYVGLQRSADGQTWNLAFVDPTKARGLLLDAVMMAKAPIAFMVPLKVERASEVEPKLKMVLSSPADAPTQPTWKIAWGGWRLSAQLQVNVEPSKFAPFR